MFTYRGDNVLASLPSWLIKFLPIQLDTFEDAEDATPFGATIQVLPGLFLLYPEAEIWQESIELINRYGPRTEPLKALEKGWRAYLGCAGLTLGYDRRLYTQRDLHHQVANLAKDPEPAFERAARPVKQRVRELKTGAGLYRCRGPLDHLDESQQYFPGRAIHRITCPTACSERIPAPDGASNRPVVSPSAMANSTCNQSGPLSFFNRQRPPIAAA